MASLLIAFMSARCKASRLRSSKGFALAHFFITHNQWPIAGLFRIARSTVTHVDMVQVTLGHGLYQGLGECRPYPRYGDNPQSVAAQLETVKPRILDLLKADALTPDHITSILPAGSARNALDCAYWDLRAKMQKRPIWELIDLKPPKPRQTAYTLSLDSPENMAVAAQKAANYSLLKIKIGGQNSIDSVKAICASRPDARLIIDANEAFTRDQFKAFLAEIDGFNIALIEQPLAAGQDDLSALTGPNYAAIPPICADESLQHATDLARLKAAGYRAVNVKLDKCGGFTAALDLMQQAKAMGFQLL